MDDLGWFGGLMDNPFRLRDNWNRQLLVPEILLLPGRLLADAIVARVRGYEDE